MHEFAEWCFHEVDESTTVIAGGHSLYFKSFFNTFLPHHVNHIGKKNKIHNSGVVGLTLRRAVVNDKLVYCIDPDSISNIYLGWKEKGKKKQA